MGHKHRSVKNKSDQLNRLPGNKGQADLVEFCSHAIYYWDCCRIEDDNRSRTSPNHIAVVSLQLPVVRDFVKTIVGDLPGGTQGPGVSIASEERARNA